MYRNFPIMQVLEVQQSVLTLETYISLKKQQIRGICINRAAVDL